MSSQNLKYQIDTAENRAFLKELREELLSFGRKFPSPGGGSYYLGDDGTPWTERGRETWITSRMAHVYSMGAMLGYDGSASLAEAAVKGLTGELHDKENGGWYAGLTCDGRPLPNKQCYAHAFVILAASSAYLAGCKEAKPLLNEALSLYDDKFWNEEEGLSCDTWNTEFTVLDEYRGLNANMHTVEAFLAAADVLKEENTGREPVGLSNMYWSGQRRTTGGFRSTLQRTGCRIWNAIKKSRMIRLSRTGQRRDTVSNGHD